MGMLLSLFDNFIAPKPVVAERNKTEAFEISVNDLTVPVKIIFEERFNNRVKVNSNGITMHISARQPKEEQRKNIEHFIQWSKNKLGEKPELLDHLPQRKYVNGEVLTVGQHDFFVTIFFQEQQKSTAKVFNNNIAIALAKGLSPEAQASTNSYLVAKCLTKYFTPIVTHRIHELNDRFFNKEINSVKLKYNTSNWGSCSTRGNINISLRLMFAKQDVIDYVLVHELAHLIHPNHSDRFWRVVERIIPDYREKEKYLVENNYKFYL
jgi:predicted metal-dependent hydrolase